MTATLTPEQLRGLAVYFREHPGLRIMEPPNMVATLLDDGAICVSRIHRQHDGADDVLEPAYLIDSLTGSPIPMPPIQLPTSREIAAEALSLYQSRLTKAHSSAAAVELLEECLRSAVAPWRRALAERLEKLDAPAADARRMH